MAVNNELAADLEKLQIEDEPVSNSTIEVIEVISNDGLRTDEYLPQNYGFQEIGMNMEPTSSKWCLQAMYCQSMKGGILKWQIGFDPTSQELIMWHGFVGGALQQDKRRVVLNNSGRLPQEQALLEARHRFTLNFRKGYQLPGSSEPPHIKVMRAEDFNGNKPMMSKLYPMFADTKLNGIRMWVRLVKTHDTLYPQGMSRGNKEFKHITHLPAELANLFPYLPHGAALDGEIFHPDYDFTEITSIVRSDVNVDPRLPNMEYHIFDMHYESTTEAALPSFEKRRAELERAITQYRKDYFQKIGPISGGYEVITSMAVGPARIVIGTHGGRPEELINLTKIFLVEGKVVNNLDEVRSVHQDFVQRDFEGSMIKRMSNGQPLGSRLYNMSTYKFGKCSHIWKLKDHHDEEGICIRVEDASGREAGCAMLVLQDQCGKVFPVRMCGSIERRRRWMQHPEEVVGKPVTFRYQVRSIYGVPQFPRGVAIRDYEPGFKIDPVGGDFADYTPSPPKIVIVD